MARTKPQAIPDDTGETPDHRARESLAMPRAAARRQAALDGMDRVVSRFATFFFDEKRHRHSLPLMASWLVGDGRHREALSILDRYWRTGSDGVDDRLLQGAILRRLRGVETSLAAYRRAWDIDPNDAAVQRALLLALSEAAMSDDLRALSARLLARARDPAVLHLALGFDRPDWSVFGVVEATDGCCTGWCAWRGDSTQRVLDVFADGRWAPLPVAAAPHSYWSRQKIHFAPFRFDWPRSAVIVEVRDQAEDVLLRGAPLMNDEVLDTRSPPVGAKAEVAVIIPVYDDAKATRRCFDALLADGSRLRRRIIAVDDASPNAMIRAHLDRLASAGHIELIRNPHNVGFIRAVNRALRRVADEDVVLLNADTHVPKGWLERLKAVARAPGVGTVTPLSNNGELVSLPGRFRSNEMPSAERIAAIDALARETSQGPVPLPNGVGFCLYIRNEALRAVGGLDAGRYERGYLEEVDFCLRVAKAGYRNVCATDVYVGHQGEASFGASKRSLVTANAVALMRRWPDIEAQTTAFVTTDPLRLTREALAWATLDPDRPRRLVIASALPLDRAVTSRLRGGEGSPLDAADLAVLSGSPAAPATWRIRLPGMDDDIGAPHVEEGQDTGAVLAGLVDRLGAREAVIVHDRDLSPEWTAAALSTRVPVDVMPVGDPLEACSVPTVRRILAPTAGVATMLARTRGGHQTPRMEIIAVPSRPHPERTEGIAGDDGATGPIGIVPADSSAATYAFIRDLGRAMLRRGSQRQLIVLGSTLRDVGIMRLGNTFVTGPLLDDHPADVLAVHPCAGLLLTQRDDSFVNAGLDFVQTSGLPFAAFPVGGACDLLDADAGGLRLDPAGSIDDIAAVVDLHLSQPGLAGFRLARP
jgi:GT2 family glycosyltransferase